MLTPKDTLSFQAIVFSAKEAEVSRRVISTSGEWDDMVYLQVP